MAMLGSSKSRTREKHDYYPTPPPTTRAILPVLKELGFPKQIWEPCCGEGLMSQELMEAGYDVVSSDLVDRGFGEQLDFLTTTRARAPALVTNPPFKHLDEIIVHALGVLGIEYLALMMSNNVWNASKRASMFADFTPTLYMPATWRIDDTGQGSPTLNFAWTFWSPNDGVCRFRPLTTTEKDPGYVPVDPLS